MEKEELYELMEELLLIEESAGHSEMLAERLERSYEDTEGDEKMLCDLMKTISRRMKADIHRLISVLDTKTLEM
ncbi:MAG: hypothetical protein K6E18_03225 [Lachnospiraceae bacterium]|nr:hypothetical protein [Lachnospiraceae bacterium]